VEDEKHKTLVRVHGGCNTLWRLRASVRAGGATPIERIRRRRTLGWGPAADTEDGGWPARTRGHGGRPARIRSVALAGAEGSRCTLGGRRRRRSAGLAAASGHAVTDPGSRRTAGAIPVAGARRSGGRNRGRAGAGGERGAGEVSGEEGLSGREGQLGGNRPAYQVRDLCEASRRSGPHVVFEIAGESAAEIGCV